MFPNLFWLATDFTRNMYTEKYADFQSSLKKSNDVFESYKNEMSKVGYHFMMTRLIVKKNDSRGVQSSLFLSMLIQTLTINRNSDYCWHITRAQASYWK